MKKLWSKLPNAKYIDWVLESMKSNPVIWIEALKQARNQVYKQAYEQVWEQVWNQARNQARNQVRNQAWYQAFIQARDQAINQAFIQARDQAWIQAYDQVSGVLLALVVYDDCEKYLSMTYSELKTWALISEKPQAILLLPLVYVKEQLNERESILCLGDRQLVYL